MKRLTVVAREACCALTSAVAALPVWAQEPGHLGDLGLRGDSGFPGLGRVVLVLVAMVALAVAVALALRRFWPPAVLPAGGALRVRAQLSLGSHLKLHFVEAGSTTVIVAEGRSGIAIAELGGVKAQPPAANGGSDAS